MNRDEHGMPLPLNESPLPWSSNDERDIRVNERRINDRDGVRVAGVWEDDDNEFIVHAANNIVPCREIVRRLAEIYQTEPTENFRGDKIFPLCREASRLWDEMKGAGDDQA